MALDDLGQVQTRQVLHDVVVGSVLGLAVVVNLDGVRMRERGGEANVAVKALQASSAGHGALTEQLHSARAFEKVMLGQVNRPHPPSTDPPAEAVLTEFPSLGDLPSQTRNRVGAEC